jgi:hypothetical protein
MGAFSSKLEQISDCRGQDQSPKKRVTVTTLDAYCAREGIESIDFIKIDVEGHERDVVRGAEDLISRRKIAVIILETDHRLVEFYNSLRSRGFRIFYYNYRNDSLKEIFPISERTLRNEPTPFSSNIILIRAEKLDAYRERFSVSTAT